MDIVTHATSGVLVALALPRRPAVRWCLPFFALCACLPDLDVVFCTSPRLFVNLHRGISHALILTPVLAFALAFLARPLWRPSTKDFFPLKRLWLLFWLCLLIHLGFDCLTTFGTRIFLPFYDIRVRLNAVFIVDLLFTVPMLVLAIMAWLSRTRRRRLACAGIIWMTLYPCFCLALNYTNSTAFEKNLRSEGHVVSGVLLLPDIFTPFYWRAVYRETLPDGCQVVREQSLGGLGRARGQAGVYTPLSEELTMHLASQSRAARDFLSMTILPVVGHMDERNRSTAKVTLAFVPESDTRVVKKSDNNVTWHMQHDGHVPSVMSNFEVDGFKFFVINDLRFGSGLALGRKLLAMRPRAAIPFRMMDVLDEQDTIVLERLIFSDIGKDTGWTFPMPPVPQTFAQWLLGMH